LPVCFDPCNFKRHKKYLNDKLKSNSKFLFLGFFVVFVCALVVYFGCFKPKEPASQNNRQPQSPQRSDETKEKDKKQKKKGEKSFDT